jgi:hypothetical protein
MVFVVPDKPADDPEAVGDPYKTLFISRLVRSPFPVVTEAIFLLTHSFLALKCPQSKKATETDVRREFEMYGAIERVRIVRNKKGSSRGYAFVVYERERDMKGKPFAFHHTCSRLFSSANSCPPCVLVSSFPLPNSSVLYPTQLRTRTPRTSPSSTRTSASTSSEGEPSKAGSLPVSEEVSEGSRSLSSRSPPRSARSPLEADSGVVSEAGSGEGSTIGVEEAGSEEGEGSEEASKAGEEDSVCRSFRFLLLFWLVRRIGWVISGDV